MGFERASQFFKELHHGILGIIPVTEIFQAHTVDQRLVAPEQLAHKSKLSGGFKTNE